MGRTLIEIMNTLPAKRQADIESRTKELIIKLQSKIEESKMSEVLYSGKWVSLKKQGTWEYVERNGNNEAAIIFPLLAPRTFVLIKEWRPILNSYLLSVPAGLVGDLGEEDPIDAAKRELEEETGYKAGSMDFLFRGPSSSGLSTEILNFYLASDLVKVNDMVGVDGERIEVVELPLVGPRSNTLRWIKTYAKDNNCMIDPKIFIGLHFIGD